MGMREEFELHYAEEFAVVRGYKPTPEEMVSMRDGDGYGASRGYLSGYWKGWKASRSELVIALDAPHNDYANYSDSEVSGACKYYEQAKKHIHSAGIRTK